MVTEADNFGIGRFNPSDPGYAYLPEKGYLGKDKAVVLVDIGGVKVKVVYFFQTIDSGSVGQGLDEILCKKGYNWKISTTLDPNGNLVVNSVDYQSLTFNVGATTTATLAATLGNSFLSSYSIDPSAVSVTFADLPAGALGQTVGTSITLDTHASGYNWFIDYTPWLNEEYLPTADANVWQARPGSDAAGKMDMLSVLLHEYGHVLGIEHSADQHASMASTLTPGTRRLPSADEMALMAQLVGEVKTGLNNTPETPTSPIPLGTTLGGLWLARLRKSAPGETVTGTTAHTDPLAMPQYSVAAHATLTNPGFTGGAGWSTTGTVTFDSTGTATLSESATAQTRLNQLFVLGAQQA